MFSAFAERLRDVRADVTCAAYNADMSYTVTLWCGCTVYVSCHPATRVAHTRIVEKRGAACPVRKHDVGARLWLWELLPLPDAQKGSASHPDLGLKL